MIRRTSSVMSALAQEKEVTFSELLCTENQILRPRDFSLDPKNSQDIMNLVDRSLVFPSMTSFTLEEMVEDMLLALQSGATSEAFYEFDHVFRNFANNNNYSEYYNDEEDEPPEDDALSDIEEVLDTTQEFTVDLAMRAIFVSETVANLNHCVQRTKYSDRDGVFFDDSWIILLCELQSVRHRKVVLARLACEMYLMPSCQAARVVLLILANSDERGMKGAVQTAMSFGTLLSHPDLMHELEKADNPDDIITIFKKTIEHLKDEGTTVLDLAGMAMPDEEKDLFEMEKPLSGIKNDIARRLPHYFDDFSDGLVGYNTIQKLLAAVVFQYFATILPVLVLGHSIDSATDHKMSTKTVIYSQFMGSIFYAVFSGNPMMMFQVSSVILLYCKVLYQFAESNDFDFNLLFGLTCFFSGIFMIVAGIFNLSNLMVYSRGSVADMVDVFQAITFIQSVSSDVIAEHRLHNCPKDDKDPECNPGRFVLNIFTIFLTVVIAIYFHGVRYTRLFMSSVREFLSDMGTPFGVILSTIVVHSFLSTIPLDTFLYKEDHSAFKFVPLANGGPLTYFISFVLAIPLFMLIFLDHNLSMEFLSDPASKLHKGHAPHFDMLVVGSINAAFGLFGMCPMQGIFPNTPLHIKQMGDVEITYDHGVQVKTLIRVRDTRLTQLLVGILVGCSTFLLPLPLGYFSRPSLNGLLLVIGFISMEGNNLIDRFKLFVTDQTAFPSNHPVRKIPVKEAHKFTLVQVVQLAIISGISFSNVNFLAILFPVCLGLLIPVRFKLLPRILESKYLLILDPPRTMAKE